MSDLADLFTGFASHWIDTPAGKIFARSHGSGPPVVLVHGFPQTHVEWHQIAPELAKTHTVIVPDLRGYGWSAAPRSDKGEGYAKRVMGGDIVALMEALGHVRFGYIGHDRGARVGYRLALDHPGRLSKLALLDILPTETMWRTMDAKRAMQVYHWTFLAQPAPMPETLIGKAPTEWLDHTLASWTLAKTLEAFDPRALAHYRAFFNDPARIHACCEDYRAGATIDLAADIADQKAGKKIEVPLLVLWGSKGIPAAGATPLDAWTPWANDLRGHAIESGHFLPEEAPAPTLKALQDFFA